MITWRTSRRYLGAALTVLCVVVQLAACAGSAVTPKSVAKLDPHKKYTVTFWEAFGSDPNKSVLASITQQYMKDHPNVTVNLQAYPDYPTLQTKLTAALAGGKPPALSQVYEEWATQFEQAQDIVTLQPFIDGPNGLSASEVADFYPKLLDDGKIDGTQYMLPFNKSDLVLYYNGALLRKLGISGPPRTLGDFESDLRQATASDGSTWGMSYIPDVDYWSVIYKGFGGKDLVSSDGSSAAFDSGSNKQDAIKALGELAGLTSGDHPAIHVYTSGFAWEDDFASDHALFAISTIATYPFLLGDSQRASDLDVEEAPLPAGPAGQFTVLFGTNLAIYSAPDADTQVAAWDYLKYLTGAAADVVFVKGTGYMPVRQSAFNSSDLQSYYAQTPARKVGPQSLGSAFVASTLPAWDKCRTAISTNFLGVMKGSLKPDAAESKMASDCNSALAQG